MVSFTWVNNPQSLPHSANFFKGEMEDYIAGNNRKFVFRLNTALDDNDLDEGSRDELKREFKKVLDTILAKPLKPLLEAEAAAPFKRFTTDKRSSKKTTTTGADGKDVSTTEDVEMTNTSNVEFIEDKNIGDLMDSDTTNRLKGGAVKHGKNLENLPEFDFDDEFSLFAKDIAIEISAQLAFTEGKDKEGEPTGKYTYAHKKADFGGVQNNHIEAEIPKIDTGKLISAQTDWLKEVTGKNATFKSKKNKNKTFTEVYDYNLVLPAQLLEELGGDADASKDSGFIEYKLSPKGKSFAQAGTKVMFSPEAVLESAAEWAMLSDKQRTPLMVTEAVVEKDGKYYKLVGGAKTSSGSSENRVIKANYKGNDMNSPYSFMEEHAQQFIDMHKRFLNNPLIVHTLSVEANIRTKRVAKPSFASTALAANAKSPTDKNPTPDRYEMVRYMVNSKKEQISLEDWDKLTPKEKSEKSDYKAHSSNLTTEEIADLSNKAFTHKTDKSEDGKTLVISESKYNRLDTEEQSKYAPNTTVFSGHESGSLNWKTMEDYSGEKYSGPSVTYETAAKAFSESIIECVFTIHTHGDFDMHPFKKGGANMELSKTINLFKKYINQLQVILGE